MPELRQSTTVTVKIGPFVDATDGVTEETGLAGSMTVEIAKNNGAFAARNSATAITHDAEGWYNVELNATDTNTLGILEYKVQDSTTHVPIFGSYGIVDQNYWDSKYSTSDLNVSVADMQANVLDQAAIATNAISNTKITTGALDDTKFAANSINSVVLSTTAAQKVRDEVTGGAYALDTDANGRVRIVVGTGAGEISATNGVANVNLAEILGTGLTETNAGDVAENVSQFFDVDPTTTNTVDDVGAGGGTDWTSTEKEHIRYRLDIAGTQTDPTTTATNLNVSVGNMQAAVIDQASIAANAFSNTKFTTGVFDATKFAADTITATVLSATAANEIRDAVNGGAYSLDTDANGRIRVVVGTSAGEISVTSGVVNANIAQVLGTALTETNAGDVADNISQFYDVEPTTTNTVDDVGMGGQTVWTNSEKDQIRYRLDMTGPQANPGTSEAQLNVNVEAVDGNTRAALVISAAARLMVSGTVDTTGFAGSSTTVQVNLATLPPDGYEINDFSGTILGVYDESNDKFSLKRAVETSTASSGNLVQFTVADMGETLANATPVVLL